MNYFNLKNELNNTKPLDDEESYIIDELLPEKGILTIVGQSKIGKTFFTQNLAYCLSVGTNFLNFKINQKQKILYINTEMSSKSLRKRFRNIIKKNDNLNQFEDFDIEYISLKDNYKMKNIDNFVENAQAEFQDKNIDILIIDPIYIFLENENDNSLVMKVLSKIEDLCSALQCSAIIVHHEGKNARNQDLIYRACGASAITRLADGIIDIYKDTSSAENERYIEWGGRNALKEKNKFSVKFNDGLFKKSDDC